jgi:symplekin
MARQHPAPADEDEYEPDDYEPEDAEQVANRLDSTGDITHVAPSTFRLPEAPHLSPEDVQRHGELAVRRTFGLIGELEEKGKGTKGGFNRLAASDYGRDAWITIAARLASRASAGLDDPDDSIKDEYAVKNVKGNLSISDTIRDLLYDYVIRDWKKRIDVAVSWLNEEWYNDTILTQSATPSPKSTTNGTTPYKGHYHRCALRLVDGILPYVAPSDKGLIRLYSELPTLDYEILSRMKTMAQDPERVGLATQVLQYLHMFRPPVKDIVVQITAELWRENDRAKPKAGGLLKNWKPEVLLEATSGEGGEVKKEEANGVSDV